MQNWAACLGFFLAAVTVSLRWTLVSLYPLGMESRGGGIHQRLPNYIPAYNGIFSIHALNFTSPSTTDTLTDGHLHLSNASLAAYHENEGQISDLYTKLFPEDGTGVNEVDSEDRLRISELTTFPQLHVVTQTIGEISTENTHETSRTIDEDIKTPHNESTSELTLTDSETLLEGPDDDDLEDPDDPSRESEDIFDRLMRTIQGHWLDFVSKMKISVLDVWKSISHHMIQRLENFATDV